MWTTNTTIKQLVNEQQKIPTPIYRLVKIPLLVTKTKIDHIHAHKELTYIGQYETQVALKPLGSINQFVKYVKWEEKRLSPWMETQGMRANQTVGHPTLIKSFRSDGSWEIQGKYTPALVLLVCGENERGSCLWANDQQQHTKKRGWEKKKKLPMLERQWASVSV